MKVTFEVNDVNAQALPPWALLLIKIGMDLLKKWLEQQGSATPPNVSPNP